MTKTLGEVYVDSLHDLDVFGGDAKVVKIDLEIPICKVFDLEVFALIFVVVVIVCRDKGVVCRGPDFGRSVVLL